MHTLMKNFEKECERIKNGGDFSKTPIEFRVPELNIIAVEKNPKNLKYVPKEYMTADLVRMALDKEGLALKYVPHDLQTQELCNLATEKNAAAAIFCAGEFATLDMYRNAMKCSGVLVRAIPPESLNEEICLLAAENGATMADIPNKYWTYDVIFAMALNGNILMTELNKFSNTTDFLKSEKMWIAAAKGDARNLEYMPRKFFTYENTLEIVKNGAYKGNPLRYLPPRFRTQEILTETIENVSARMSEGKAKWRMELAVMRNGLQQYNSSEDTRFSLEGLDTKFLSYLTPDLIKKCVTVYTGNLRYVPKKQLTEELIEWTLGQPILRAMSPGETLYPELNKWNRTEYYLEDVPLSMRTEKICLRALGTLKVADILSIPDAAKTKEMIRYIIGHEEKFPARTDEAKLFRADALTRFVPVSMIDKEIYQLVFTHIEANIPESSRSAAILKKWQRKAEKAGLHFIDVPKEYMDEAPKM